MQELTVIRKRLMDLLDENSKVTDIEKLERDEFVVDTEKQKAMVEEGDKTCEEIREEAAKTQLQLELLKERTQELTWDKMEVQAKAVCSIRSDMLVHNYGIRKKETQETRRLEQIKNFRRNELRERIQRLEAKIEEVLPEKEYSRIEEQYIVNRVAGKPEFVEDNSQAEAVAEFA